MCNKLASLAQAREAHGAFGKAFGAPRPGTAESVLPLAEKGACLHSGTGCAKAVFSEMSIFSLGK